MFQFRRFAGERFAQVNEIIELQLGLITNNIHLIASACYPFPEVLNAMSMPVQVFPAEGMVGRRYHPANEALDKIEIRAEQILRNLFGTSDRYGASIQPHSCTQANQIVFNAVLHDGNIVLSLSPDSGGHVSHTVVLGRRFRVEHYRLTPDGAINYEELEELAARVRPRLIISGGSACPRQIDWRRIGQIAAKTGAFVLADISHPVLFVISGDHQNAVPYVDFITFSTSKTLRGPTGGVLLFREEHRKMVERAIFPISQGGPLENVLFAKLVCLELLQAPYTSTLARTTIANARALARSLTTAGLTVVSGGTDSHVVLVDLSGTQRTGIEIERDCLQSGILVNHNIVPGETRSLRVTSGIRLGSINISILGCTPDEAFTIGQCVADIIERGPLPQDNRILAFREKYHRLLLPPNGV